MVKRCDSSRGDKIMNRIQSPFTLAKHGHSAAALFAVVLALAGFANADGMYSAHSHKAKKGHLTITAPIEVGGAILQPGNYEVREANSPSGSVVEFVHQFRNELASELVQADEEEVVARVQYTEQALSSPPKHTRLILASDTAEAASLEIRGSAVGYEFPTPQMAGKPKEHPAAVSTNAGQQE
jgi:membrane-associated protease RseP (regulator of RpoE activity)